MDEAPRAQQLVLTAATHASVGDALLPQPLRSPRVLQTLSPSSVLAGRPHILVTDTSAVPGASHAVRSPRMACRSPRATLADCRHAQAGPVLQGIAHAVRSPRITLTDGRRAQAGLRQKIASPRRGSRLPGASCGNYCSRTVVSLCSRTVIRTSNMSFVIAEPAKKAVLARRVTLPANVVSSFKALKEEEASLGEPLKDVKDRPGPCMLPKFEPPLFASPLPIPDSPEPSPCKGPSLTPPCQTSWDCDELGNAPFSHLERGSQKEKDYAADVDNGIFENCGSCASTMGEQCIIRTDSSTTLLERSTLVSYPNSAMSYLISESDSDSELDEQADTPFLLSPMSASPLKGGPIRGCADPAYRMLPSRPDALHQDFLNSSLLSVMSTQSSAKSPAASCICRFDWSDEVLALTPHSSLEC